MKLSTNQKRILKKLITKFENSKTYEKSNKLKQSFYVKPSEIFKNYYSDFADMDEVSDFENDTYELQSEGYVEIKYKKHSSVIDKIYLNVSKVDQIRSVIGIKEKKEIKTEELRFFEGYMENDGFSGWYSSQEIERIRVGKKIRYSIPESKIIIELIDRIIGNKDELLERELSIITFGNSKTFENSYRRKACRLLSEYLEAKNQISDLKIVDSSDTERDHLLLERYGIYQNPAYVYIKGNIKIKHSDERIIDVMKDSSIAISASLINQINEVVVSDKNIVTVENLTSFHRIEDENTSFIYTGGYSGRTVKRFLQYINHNNSDKSFYHFGDLDPDGFCILDNLIDATGIDIKPLHMDMENLIKYKPYAKPLTERDVKLARSLIKKGHNIDILKYMIEENIKLEQEIITYNLK